MTLCKPRGRITTTGGPLSALGTTPPSSALCIRSDSRCVQQSQVGNRPGRPMPRWRPRGAHRPARAAELACALADWIRTIHTNRCEAAMATCETCGNDYDKAFQVKMNGSTHTFDSFECAIHALAPTCAHCGIRIVGHGLEKGTEIFCCAHCAEHEGVHDLRDRA